MNPLYQQLMGGGFAQPMPGPSPSFPNPMAKMQFILQAMTNPAAFVRQQFPDIPQEISNNPQQILQYLQQTRGISSQQIQQAQQMAGQMFGG